MYAELNSTSNDYTLGILLTDPSTPKQEIPEKKCDDDVIITFFQVFLVFGVAGFVKSMQCGYSLDHHIFPGISCFWGSGVRQKHAVWVLIGCGIKFRIQGALPIEI